MKKFHIKHILEVQRRADMGTRIEEIVVMGNDNMQVSDGFHTMDELYDHRITLFIALCRARVGEAMEGVLDAAVWRSKLHNDGTSFEGWFILGINEKPGTQITYHLPIDRWDETDFAETLDKAPEFDGHTPADVLERLKKL